MLLPLGNVVLPFSYPLLFGVSLMNEVGFIVLENKNNAERFNGTIAILIRKIQTDLDSKIIHCYKLFKRKEKEKVFGDLTSQLFHNHLTKAQTRSITK